MLLQGKGKGAAPDKGKALAASKGKQAVQAEQPAASTSGRQALWTLPTLLKSCHGPQHLLDHTTHGNILLCHK